MFGLSVPEAHAIGFGAIHATGIAVAIVLGFQGVPYGFEAAITLVATVFVLLGWLPKGDAANLPGVQHVLARIPPTIKGQIRNEQHYYGATGIAVFTVELISYVGWQLGLIPGL